jgi:hypothetical protein
MQAAQQYLSMSAQVTGTLHLAALASKESCGGLLMSHANASLSLAVAALGTYFTTSKMLRIRRRNAWSATVMGLTAAHCSGTMRHNKWRMRAVSSVSTAEYGHASNLWSTVRAGGSACQDNAIGIYKISRDRSVRETSHKVNVNESTYVNE